MSGSSSLVSSISTVSTAQWFASIAAVGAAVVSGRKLLEWSDDNPATNIQSKFNQPVAASSAPNTTIQPPVGNDKENIPADIFPQYIKSASVPQLWLFTRCWEVDQPRCIVFLIHGYGEHSGRYEGIATYLNTECGASVYALDHQGHGQSDGERAYVRDFGDYVTDALTYVEHVQQTRLASLGYSKSRLPCFLLGHSMGGLIASQMMRASYVTASGTVGDVARRSENWPERIWPWTSCILSSPALAPNPRDAKPILVSIASTISRLLPKVQVTGLSVDGISRRPEVVEAYKLDPLNWHGRMKARWGYEMIRNMEEVRKDLSNIDWPVLLIQGDSDLLVHAAGAQIFHDGIASKDKKIRRWAEGYHELFWDLHHVADAAMKEVGDWVNSHVETATKQK